MTQELREQGSRGQPLAVWRCMQRWRDAETAGGAGRPLRDRSVPAHPSPRAVVWWLLCPQKRTEAQTAFVARLEERSPTLRLAHEVAGEFFALVRQREAEGLEALMRRAEASGLPELVSFSQGVRRDWEAVVAGLTWEWSNCPVEGHVNRLKGIKRQMYGRAGFPLLRARVRTPA